MASQKTPNKLPKNTQKCPSHSPKTRISTSRALPGATKASQNETLKCLGDPKAFQRLQKRWYGRLRDTGFKDIEVTKEGFDEPAPNLQGASLRDIADRYTPERETYYRILTNFLTHCPYYEKRRPLKRLVALMYAEGKTYRNIVREVKKRRMTVSLAGVYWIVKAFERRALQWDRTNKEGLLFTPTVGLPEDVAD